MRPASASPVLRMKFLAMLSALVLAAGALCRAEEPSLSVYQIIPGDSENPRGELIMKLNNPPGRTYYLYTPGITSILAAIEVQKDGQWIDAPRETYCLTSFYACARTHPFLPDSYVVFDTDLPPSLRDYSVFRVNVRLLTAPPDLLHPEAVPPGKGYIDLVSEPFSTKDLKPVKLPPTPASEDHPQPTPPGK